MALSNIQIESNRANAQHSTGPRTPEGKQRSSLNATRHGLTGQVVVLPSEDFKVYSTHCQEFFEEWRPSGPTEKHLIQSLADAQWRVHRGHARERGIFAMGHEQMGDQVNTKHPEVHALFTSALVESEHGKDLDRLSRYTSRLQRDYFKILKEVKILQAERKAREQAELEQAAMLQKYFEMKKEVFKPEEFGFVLTAAKIDRHIFRTSHVAQAQVAKLYGYDIKKYNTATQH